MRSAVTYSFIGHLLVSAFSNIASLTSSVRFKYKETIVYQSTVIIITDSKRNRFTMAFAPAGVPPGLEYLTQIDQILIQQKMELLEVFIGFETKNQYDIKNSMGQKIFSAKEDTDCCTRNCCGPLRPFDLLIKNHNDQEVIHLIRPLRCTCCCCPCCLQEIEVQSPPGTTIGYVVQNWHMFLPKLSVLGPSKENLLQIEGPCCAISCCGDVDFVIKGKDDQAIGKISKQWTGLVKEVFTDTDNFGVSFPLDLDVKLKAVLLGACFLIDFMFFESTGDSGQRCTVFG